METTLNATIATQAAEITALEPTVAAACTQLETLSGRIDEIATAVGGIGLVDLFNLGGLGLKIPTLPAPLATRWLPLREAMEPLAPRAG
jgi:hypothetical protein